MDSQDKQFFELIRAGLWGTPVESKFTRQMLGRYVRIALSQAVLGVVADVIISDESLAGVLDTAEIKPLRRFVMSNLSTSRTWNITLQKIVQELRSEGIDPYVLKGQGIAQYYPNPDLRQCGDIDLYVGQKDYERTCEIVGVMGAAEDHEYDEEILKHFHTRIGNVPVEIHRYTDVYYQKRLDRIYQGISDEGLSAEPVMVDIAGFKIMTPPVDFNVFYIFNHLWHHFIADGVGLRQICDWARLLHKHYGQINLDHLRGMLVKMGLMKSAMGIGALLLDGIGDTIRVSLTDDPIEEVYAAKDILKAAGLRKEGVNIISCPTCGRTQIDLIGLVNQVDAALKDCNKPITVAVMGCIVNGPGEAREADIGIAGGDGCGMLFEKGKQIMKLPYEELLPALLKRIEEF